MAFRRKNKKAGSLGTSDTTGRREKRKERNREQAGSVLTVWEQLPSRLVVEFNQLLTRD